MDPIVHESDKTRMFADSIVLRYSQRANKGVPNKQYELDSKVKYPINNYVLSYRLFESLAFTVNLYLFLVMCIMHY